MGSTTAVQESAFYTPSQEDVEKSQLTAFMRHCERETGRSFADHDSFQAFSVEEFRTFWRLFLDWSGVVHEGSEEPVCVGDGVEDAEFFPEVRLNYVENLLRVLPGREKADVLVAHHATRGTVRLTRRQLRAAVVGVARSLRARGVRAGDRVVAVSTNNEHLVVASLAAMALGATISTAAPEMGTAGIVARFGPLAPTWLLYGVEDSPLLAPEIRAERLRELVDELPTVEHVLVLDGLRVPADLRAPVATLTELVQEGSAESPESFRWERFGFSHPLCILFSSGTTGPPKCIVHAAGGVLLEHTKEHLLHGDLGCGDVMLFQTSPAWMMWNWQLSALFTGAAIVLYDGPVSDPASLWSIVESDDVTVFGTGPAYLRFCETAGFRPRDAHVFARLRLLMSTGSILHDDQFDWVRDNVAEIPVHSISGGTDIVGCFVLGNPNLPVHRGELQSRSLGLDVRATGADEHLPIGELTCWNPFPSRPNGLYADPDGAAFHRAYFADNAGAWTHGDRIEMTERGSARIHGRSDGVMNIGGIRIGPAEIYALLSGVPEVVGSLAVEQQVPNQPEQSQVVLLVVLAPGAAPMTAELEGRIRHRIAHGATSAHVPALVVKVPELPVTHSGKDSERAARDVVNGLPVGNAGALRNPGCLDLIGSALAEAQAREAASYDAVLELDDSADEVEALEAIFASVLHLPTVAADDNYFDLGGTSLRIAYVCAAIHERLGYDLPLSSVFSAPTPAALSDLIHRGQGEGPEHIVLMRPGDSAQRPVFLIYPLTGNGTAYHHLVSRLPGNRPVYSVEARGLSSHLSPDESIEDMAESAIDAIRTIQPGGTYTLVGYSLGGLIAYEMASRLAASGSETDVVAMLDTYVDAGALRGLDRVRYEVLGRPVGWAGWLLKRGPRKLARRLLPRLRGTRAPRTPRQAAVRAMGWRAIKAYRPSRVDSRVVFFRSSDRFRDRCDPVWVFRRSVAPSQLTVVPVTGNHAELMDEERVADIAHRLGPFLELGPGAA